jgi:hypothetical protein
VRLWKAEPAPSRGEAQAALAREVASSSDALADLTRRALATRDFARWYEDFNAELWGGHRRSWALGRRLAGDLADDDEGDGLVARAIVDAESEWSLRFLADLEDGRYDEDPDRAAARAQLYPQKYRGTANRAWVEAGPEDAEFAWVMTAVEHCVDCPTLAAMSPWRRDELGWLPGEGGTACLTNCKCVLVRADGATGFEPL